MIKAQKIIAKRMSEQGVLRALQRRGEKADVDAFTGSRRDNGKMGHVVKLCNADV